MSAIDVEDKVSPTIQPPAEDVEPTLSIVLFSGTDDRLMAAAVLVAGAAAMGRPVNVFLQYWALDAFRADQIDRVRPLAPEAPVERAHELRRAQVAGRTQHWAEIFRQAKEIGQVSIHACALTMDVFGFTKDELDPLVDGVEGVAAFMLDATGPVAFI